MGNDIKITGDMTPIAEGIKDNLLSIPSGIEKLLCLAFGEKYIKRVRSLYLSKAQIAHDINKILAGELVFDGNEVSYQNLPSIQNQILINKSISESANIIKCIEHAINIMKDKEEQNFSEDISRTFFNRWRNEAQFISEENIQYLWGKILAEEVSYPNKFSLATIDILKNIGNREATIFDKISPYIIFGENMLMGDDYKKPLPNVSVQDLQILNDIGLLEYRFAYATTGSLLKTQRCDSNAFFLDISDYALIIYTDNAPNVSFQRLTKAGRELYNIMAIPSIDQISETGRFLLNQKEFQQVNKIEILKYVKKATVEGECHQTEDVCWVVKE